MPSTACCGQPRHKKCEKKLQRTLAKDSNACAQCRDAFQDPCDPVTEAKMSDRIGLYKRVVSKDISQ